MFIYYIKNTYIKKHNIFKINDKINIIHDIQSYHASESNDTGNTKVKIINIIIRK